MTDTSEETRPRGRPRSETAQTAILSAAIALLLDQGLHAMSMDDVAERAGVSKATIYRWWASKELLALDALSTEWATPTSTRQRDTGSLRGDLLAQLRPWIRQLNEKPFGRVIAGLIARGPDGPRVRQALPRTFRPAPPRRNPPAPAPRDRPWRDRPRHRPRSHPRPALRPDLPPAAARPRPAQRPLHSTGRRRRHQGHLLAR